MSKLFVFEKPLGMRDVLPNMVKQKHALQLVLRSTMEQWGYEPIQTPTLEYHDTVGGFSATMEQRLFKLLDRSGRTVVLRPDMTGPIARVVGSLLKDQAFPIRLYYEGNVYRAQQNEAGRNAEFPEVGIECIGEDAPDADAEVITLAVQCLQAAQVKSFKLTIGHVGFINALLTEVVQDQEQVNRLKQSLHHKNIVGYKHDVQTLGLNSSQQKMLLSLPLWKGDIQVIEDALRMTESEQVRQALINLQQLWQVLNLHGVEDKIIFDLSLVSHMDYYTGMFFEGYAEQIGFPICSGGRYDQLLQRFGRPAPATGFALKVDRILEASSMNVGQVPERILVTYKDADREKAFVKANQLRVTGCQVALHRIKVNQHLETIVQGYDSCVHVSKEEVD